MAYGNTGFKEGSTDVFNRYVSKEYLMEYYPDLLPSKIAPRLWTWGSNSSGQLGDGTTISRSSPVTTAGGGTNWKQIGAGNYATAAIKTDGTLWTWGENEYGQLGTGTTTSRTSPGTTAGGGTNWKQVSSGSYAVAAIKTDGTLWTWGINYINSSAAILGDGLVSSRTSPGTTAGGGTNWKQVSMGRDVAAAIKTDGTLWTWGTNLYGALGIGSGTNTTSRSSPVTTAGGGTNWKQVSCSDEQIAAIKTDGTLWTWGGNSGGQLGDGTFTNRSSPGTTAGGGTTWKQVAMAYNHTAAIKTDGTLWTWGQNVYGQLGNGNQSQQPSPVTTAGGGTNWKQVSGSLYATVALKTDGTLWTWGSNVLGVLGTQNNTDRSSPGTTAGGGTNWKQVSSGYYKAAAINESGNW